MKKILIFLIIIAWMFLGGCSTIIHKDVSTHWQGYGVKLEYESKVAIPPEMIPEFIDAVDRLENLLQTPETE